MSILTLAILGTIFALFYATGYAGDLLDRRLVPVDAPRPVSHGSARLLDRFGGSDNSDDYRRVASDRWRESQYRPADVSQVEKLRQTADLGDVQAQFNLGLCYEFGRGVAKDQIMAMKWFRDAAEQGYDEAQYTLGCCYNGDEGFPKDAGEAVKWWGKAAAQGHANAEYCLGLIYYVGQGVPRNPAESIIWWGEAAEQGHANAQYFLGLCYYMGFGTPKQEKLGLYWLRKAEAHGNENARSALEKLAKTPAVPEKK